jgi:dTDP-4-amino-4,6-dideoxygalactose transaminase
MPMKPFEKTIYVTAPLLPPLEAVNRRLREVWASGWLTNNGRQNEILEAALRDLLRVKHLSLFNNGTIALFAAAKALQLSGEVITTPFTFPATPHALMWNDITPVFVDVDPVRLTLDPARVAEAITPRTTGMLGVHVYGVPCDVHGLQRVADRNGLKVIYDAAHAFGTTLDGAGIGTFGDVTMFSFHATKLFHTAEGGALVCGDAALRERINHLRNFGIVDPETVDGIGLNGKMSELQAALGLAVLDCVDAEIAARRRLIALYHQLLGPVPGIAMAAAAPGIDSNPQYYAVRIDADRFGCSRDVVHAELLKHNVVSRKYFFPLCSDYPCYSGLPSADRSRLPVATRAAREVLCLPLYGSLEPSAVERICEIISALQGAAV